MNKTIRHGMYIVGIITCISIAFVVHSNQQPHVLAQQSEEQLQRQISSAQVRIAEINRRIAELGNTIASTSEERRTLEAELQRIENERRQLLNQIDLATEQINQTQLEIETLNNDILTTEQRIQHQRKAFAQSIRLRNELEEKSLFELLLTGEDLSVFWRHVNNLQSVQEASQRYIYELQGLTYSLSEIIEEQSARQRELETYRAEIEDQRALVEMNRNEQSSLVNETRNEEERYKAQLAAEEARRDAFERELQEYEAQLQFLANPTALPARGSAPLSWPLDNITVTQQFGARTGPHRTYVNGHSGTDFRARTPQKLYSMAPGVVMGVGDTDTACRGVSFGKWITIKHDNNLVSTYAHLSLINVEPGQRVDRRELIGYTGNTGRTTAPHLHISLYAGVDAEGNNPVEIKGAPSQVCTNAMLVQPRAAREAYLDPLDYLPPATRDMFKQGVFEQRPR